MKFRPKTAPHEENETYIRPQAQFFDDSYTGRKRNFCFR